MHFAEVLLNRLDSSQTQRLGQIQTKVLGFETLLLYPFLHHFFVSNDFDTRFVNVEGQLWVSFRMEFPKLILVIVMIGRTQNNATHSALSDKGVLALWRFGGGPFG